MKKKVQYVYVEWKDHCSSGRQKWRVTDDIIDGLMGCSSIGFILNETKDVLTLGMTAGLVKDDKDRHMIETYTGDITIAKKLITRRKNIKI